MKSQSGMAGLLGVPLFLFGLVTYLFTGALGLYSIIHLAGGALLILFWLTNNVRDLRDMASGRAVRTFGQTAGTAIALLVAVVAVNLITTLYPKQFDWTRDKVFSLSPQSEKILANLPADVSATLFQQGGEAPREEDLLKLYAYAQPRFHYEIVDPDQRPTLAQQHEVRQNGTLILASQGRTQKITELNEQEITNGLIQLLAGARTTVGFLVDHDERPLEGEQQPGALSMFKMLLEESNYGTRAVSIVQEGRVPADVDVLVVAAPTQPLLPQEIAAIEDFARQGGDLLIALDPQRRGGVPLAAARGIGVGDDLLLDQELRLFEGPVLGTQILAADYGDHPSVAGFGSRSLFQESCSLDLAASAVSGVTVSPLVRSSETAWAETDLKRLFEREEADFGGNDRRGPVPLAAAWEGYPGAGTGAVGSSGVVFCDSDFLTDRFIGQVGNADLALNVVAWMSGKAEQVSIRPRTRAMSRVELESDEMVNLFYMTVLIFPEALLLLGLVTWWRRRHVS